MTAIAADPPLTLADSFSFYLPSSDIESIKACGELADGVTVKGPRGPDTIVQMRAGGWDRPVIFDRAGYDPSASPIDPEHWFDLQAHAGADRLLTAGTWIPWDQSGESLRAAVEVEAKRTSSRPDASALFAVDYRWLTKDPVVLASALIELDRPVALVLAHRGDPLGANSAVHGLLTVARAVDDLSILRTDHGGLGAIVHGARHAAIGLIPTYRHFVPVGTSGGGKTDDRTARVFVREMLDWFTALTISGWATVPWDLRCHLRCCEGRSLTRFFDPRFEREAMHHNRVALAQLAVDILEAPRDERRRLFAEMCSAAIGRHGPMGKLSMVTEPKPQLVQWAFV